MKTKLASICAAACLLLWSQFLLARPAGSPQDQGTVQTQPVPKAKKHKPERSPAKEIGKGGEDIGKGAGKGAESLGKGTAKAAGKAVTLHPVDAASDLGKGAAGAGKDVGVGTVKGSAKIGKGSAKGVGKLGKKIVGKGGKKKTDKTKSDQ